MPSWFNKQKRSHPRTDEREILEASVEELTVRKALAASVEELAVQGKLTEDEWSEEEEDEADGTSASGGALIPPRLRLQSRPMPSVRIDVARQVPMKREAALENISLVQAPGKRLGRSTKVHLQALQSGSAREPITERIPIVEKPEPARGSQSIEDGRDLVQSIDVPAVAALTSSPSSLLCGSGVIETGQKDATIHNQRISAQSVVTVMLSGDPGPVVVHYVSLQPRAGFTLHMSAPVTVTTPFNYAIWLM